MREKATLIYNPNARSTGAISSNLLERALHDAGYDPVYTPTRREEDLDDALAHADGGLVVAAGGDGTVRATALRLLNRDVALSILPLGTANNIARTFGIDASPLDIIASLADPFVCDFDVGRVETPWGTHYFLEALGFGFYADALRAYRPTEQKSVLRAVGAFAKTLPDYQAKPFRMTLDGKDISGNYLLVEMLNTTAFGPRLRVAPRADTADGLFEVIRILEEERDPFGRYLVSLFAEELDELPSVEASQGQRLELQWRGFPLHIDGEVHPYLEARPSARNRPDPDEVTIVVDVIPQALEFWLPHEPQ